MTSTTKTKKLTVDEQVKAAKSLDKKLQILTADLGKVYDKWKEVEESKDTRKSQFFDLLTDFIEENVVLERTTEQVYLKDGEEIADALTTRYRDMRVVITPDGEPLMEENPENDREWIVVMEPDPKLMKYQYVNPKTKMVYARGRIERGADFDVIGFADEFPELADKCVTKTVTLSVASSVDLHQLDAEELLSLASATLTLDEEKAEALVVADPSLLAVFMKFRMAPKVSMSLLKPRKAKADELA